MRRSRTGGRTWEASLVLNGHGAYSYSCLSQTPQPGMIGLAWETVLPGTKNPRLRKGASANNIVFTLIPTNFSNATVSAEVSAEATRLKNDDARGDWMAAHQPHHLTPEGLSHDPNGMVRHE